MPQQKRPRNAKHDPDNERLPPKKSARHATTVSPGDRSHEPSKSADDGRTREEIPNDAALIQEVSKIVDNEEKAELLLLELMRKYTFSFTRLKVLLRRKAN